jgi:serine/threonine-protein kinase
VLAPGDLLGDRYRLDEFLASGGMGQVWKATDTVLHRTVAVKVMLPALLSDPGFEARFRAEARIIAALRHPAVVNVYDYGESTDANGRRTLFLVMAFVDGEPLSRRLARLGRLSAAETMSVVAQAADALAAAHAGGVVHRDVKPGNLIVQPDGAVMLVDFGVARSATMTALTTGGEVPGTALYMAPEQASGQLVTPATDIYALGAVAYHCLAGEPPFTGDTPVSIALKHLQDEPPPLPEVVPEPTRDVVERAMAKDPNDRYPSATVLAAAARSAGGRPAASAIAAGRLEPATEPDLRPIEPEEPEDPANGHRRRGALIGAAVAALALIAALILLYGLVPDDTKQPPAGDSTPTQPPGASNSPRPTTRTTGPTRTASPTPSAPASPTQTAGSPTPTEEPPTSAPPQTPPVEPSVGISITLPVGSPGP